VRLIVDESADMVSAHAGVMNMAIDEAMLQSAAEEGVTSLRFYTWEAPTLSLGYFQRAVHRADHEASQNCPWLRRASGGGAIMHDRELTYSFAMPSDSRFGDSEIYYLAFHETLVEVLRDMRIDATVHPPDAVVSDEAFLCFQRRASGDVILGGSKIAGSAQRRWKNALLQHGSVLLAKSAYAPELPGLQELSDFAKYPLELARNWCQKLQSQLKADFTPSRLTDREISRVDEINLGKFSAESWRARR